MKRQTKIVSVILTFLLAIGAMQVSLISVMAEESPDMDGVVESLQITKLPDKLSYIAEYEEFDPSGFEMKVFFDDGKSVIYSYDTDGEYFYDEPVWFDLEDGNILNGDNKIVVQYMGCTVEFNVTGVEGSLVENIQITKLPDKLTYMANFEGLDLSGLEMLITYKDTSTSSYSYDEDGEYFYDEKLNLDVFVQSEIANSEYGCIALGENTVTINYVGCKAEFTVTGEEVPVQKIEITKLPDKINYLPTDTSVDMSGAQMTVYYKDGTDKVYSFIEEAGYPTHYWLDEMPILINGGFGNIEDSNPQITISYLGVETTFDITIGIEEPTEPTTEPITEATTIATIPVTAPTNTSGSNTSNDKSSPNNTNTSANTAKSPIATGDLSSAMLIILALLLATSGVFACMLYKRKRNV